MENKIFDSFLSLWLIGIVLDERSGRPLEESRGRVGGDQRPLSPPTPPQGGRHSAQFRKILLKPLLCTIFLFPFLPQTTKADTLSLIVASHIYPILFEGKPEGITRIVEEMKAYNPDALVLPGDIIPGTWDIDKWDEKVFSDTIALRKDLEAQWARVDSIFKPLGVPVFVAPGNHDISSYTLKFRQTVKDIFLEKTGPEFQSFSLKGCQFILLNSVDFKPKRHIYNLKKATVDSLTQTLQRIEGTEGPILVFLHHPLWYQKYFLSPANVPVWPHIKWMKDIHPMFVGRQAYLFAGDAGDHHNYLFHETRDDVTYYLNGSGRGGTSFMHVKWDGQQVSIHPRFLDVAVPQKKAPDGWIAEFQRVIKLKTFWGGVGFGAMVMTILLLVYFLMKRKRISR